MLSSFLIALQFFLIALPLHLLVCRLTSSYKFVLKSILLGLFTLLFLAGYEHQKSSVDLVSLYLFTTFWFLYLKQLIQISKSSSYRMLAALASNPNGELHLNEFCASFKEDERLKNRIILMKSNGFISLNNERLCLTSKAKYTLSIMAFMRRLFSLDVVINK